MMMYFLRWVAALSVTLVVACGGPGETIQEKSSALYGVAAEFALNLEGDLGDSVEGLQEEQATELEGFYIASNSPSEKRAKMRAERKACYIAKSSMVNKAANKAVYFALFPDLDSEDYTSFDKSFYTVDQAKEDLKEAKAQLQKLGLDVDSLETFGVDLGLLMKPVSEAHQLSESTSFGGKIRMVSYGVADHIVSDEFVDFYKKKSGFPGYTLSLSFAEDDVKAAVKDFFDGGHDIEDILDPDQIEDFKKYINIEIAAYKARYPSLDKFVHFHGDLGDLILKDPRNVFEFAEGFVSDYFSFNYLRWIVEDIEENRAALKAAHKVFVEAGAGSCDSVAELINFF